MFTQLPPGAAMVTSGPRLLKPTLLPACRMAAMAATPGQFAGDDTTVPSLPAEITASTLRAVSSATTSWYEGSQAPSLPRLRLRMRAGVGLSGMPATCRPAAQRMPAMMSLSRPPHLPSTRTGRIHEFHARPETPTELLVSAPIIPATRVPCQLLSVTSQFVKAELDLSLE